MRVPILLFVCLCVLTLPSCVSSQRRQALAPAMRDIQDDVALIVRVLEIQKADNGVFLELLVREVFEDKGNDISRGDRIRLHVPDIENVVMGNRLTDTPVANDIFGYLIIFRDAFDWDYCGRVSVWEWVGYEAAPPVAAVATVVRVLPSPPWPSTVLVTLRIERVHAYHGKPYILGRYVEVYMRCIDLEAENITPDVIGTGCRAVYIDPRAIWGMWNE